MSGMFVATGVLFWQGAGTNARMAAASPLDLLAEVQGIIKQAGLVATRVFQHPAERVSEPWPSYKPGAIEVHLEPGTTPEQAQAAVDEVVRKMPAEQRVVWSYDVVPLGGFDEEAERARAAFDAAMGGGPAEEP